MNLIIDFGNTRVKIAVFGHDEMLFQTISENRSLVVLKEILEKYLGIQNAIISSVSDYPGEIRDYLMNILHTCIELDRNTPLPIENLYLTKESLGYDRIAGVVGAAAKFPGKDILVIDAGTAITYDFVNYKGQFLGGSISPGAYTRAKALNKFTSRLPLVEPKDEWIFPGKTTEEAILSGVMAGLAYEIDGYIDDLKIKYPDLITVLTGGESKYFDKKLKNSIFVDSNLNLYGLNRILKHNAY